MMRMMMMKVSVSLMTFLWILTVSRGDPRAHSAWSLHPAAHRKEPLSIGPNLPDSWTPVNPRPDPLHRALRFPSSTDPHPNPPGAETPPNQLRVKRRSWSPSSAAPSSPPPKPPTEEPRPSIPWYTSGYFEVSCVYKETCILPCSFEVGPHIEIIWWLRDEFRLHAYYLDQDQLGLQDDAYRNRTSLFKDQISAGNASLQLTGVKVQDEDTYECFAGPPGRPKLTVVSVKVHAPVHKVNIQQVENRITCSSEGIYPEPELTWTTRPPSTMSLQNTSTVQQNEQQLYSISSSLVLSHSDPDLVYSCTVSTPTNRRRAAWRKLTPVNGSTPETNITCAASDFSFSDLVWRFNHRQIIVKQSRTDGSSTVSEEWRQQVKDVSESGDITLQDLSSDQEGIYTCEVSNAEETLISDTYVEISGGSSVSAGGIIGGVVGAVLVLTAAVGLFLFWKKKKRGQQDNSMRRSDIDENTFIQLESENTGRPSTEEKLKT